MPPVDENNPHRTATGPDASLRDGQRWGFIAAVWMWCPIRSRDERHCRQQRRENRYPESLCEHKTALNTSRIRLNRFTIERPVFKSRINACESSPEGYVEEASLVQQENEVDRPCRPRAGELLESGSLWDRTTKVSENVFYTCDAAIPVRALGQWSQNSVAVTLAGARCCEAFATSGRNVSASVACGSHQRFAIRGMQRAPDLQQLQGSRMSVGSMT